MGKNALFLKIMPASLAPYSKSYLHLIWQEQLTKETNKKNPKQKYPQKTKPNN